MDDLADRLITRVQLTSDGYKCYSDAVDHGFAGDVDYAKLIKSYGIDRSGDRAGEARYSPGVVLSVITEEVCGTPDPRHICTSHVERQNLTMRMSMRRFTRLTNGFSKKIENMKHAVAINFAFYNFCRVHQSLRVTPAMEAGLTDRVWELEELVALLGIGTN